MQKKIQNRIVGAGLVFLVLLSVFAFALSKVQSNSEQHISGAVEAEKGERTDGISQASNANDQTIEVAILDYSATTTTNTKLPQDEKLPIAASNTSNDEPVLGTETTPQTQVDAIIQTVNELVQKWEASISGKAGWLHLQTQVYIPVTSRGNGLPEISMTDLFPEDISIQDEWFHIDEAGHYPESLTLTSTPDGIIRQRVIFSNGRLVNLTLLEAGVETPNSTISQGQKSLILPESDALGTLHTYQDWGRTFQAWLSENSATYTVSSEQVFTETIEIANASEPIQGDKLIYTFDWQTGRLISTEFQVLTKSGLWLTLEKRDYLVAELLTDLPANTTQIFQESIAQLKENN